MATGAVSFHSDKRVKRIHIPTRENAIVNRLAKTKTIVEVDHEADRIERLRQEGKVKRAAANLQANKDAEEKKRRAEEKANRGYGAMFSEENGYGVEKGPRDEADGSEDEASDDDFW